MAYVATKPSNSQCVAKFLMKIPFKQFTINDTRNPAVKINTSQTQKCDLTLIAQVHTARH